MGTLQYDLTIFKTHLGRLTAKAYTKGERVLRFEAIVHNTAELNCGRVLDKFPDIISRLAGMTERFCTALDCMDTTFIPDGTLEDLPVPSLPGATRVSGVDLNKPRMRSVLAATLALSAAPGGFTVAEFAATLHAMTGQAEADYTVRQAAYDLRKLRGKHLLDKPGRTRRYHVPGQAARTIAAQLTIHGQVIAPIMAGVRSPRRGRRPSTWTAVDRDYEQLRIDMQTLFTDLGISVVA